MDATFDVASECAKPLKHLNILLVTPSTPILDITNRNDSLNPSLDPLYPLSTLF